jgi:tRNA-Thr(GGU) m(6)t(6)A37 methyltransferase TsaA
MKIQMQPIGSVANEVPHGTANVRWESVVSTITICSEWAEGLDGLEEFSHIIVIFYLRRSRGEGTLRLKTHPMGRQELSEVGIFATRTPVRPNGIGVTTVRLLGREENLLTVEGLDAFDGTPVLDIKPYLTRGDRISDATVADWVRRLWRMLDSSSPANGGTG